MANNQRNRRFSLVLLLFLISAALCGALWMSAQAAGTTTYYVKSDGDAKNAGTGGWDDAIPLSHALGLASEVEGNVQILCASGDYTAPAAPVDGWEISASNVTIKGGYKGTDDTTLEGTSTLIGSGNPVITINGGGGASIIDGITIDGFTITSGDSYFEGGGIAVYDADGVTINSCDIKNNSAPQGGGIYVDSDSEVTVTNSTFQNNRAVMLDGDGGGAIMNNGKLILENCTFDGNSSSTGGGIYATGDLDVVNCTFVDNTITGTEDNGKSIYIPEDIPAINVNVINSIFWGEEDTSTAKHISDGATVEACIVKGGVALAAATRSAVNGYSGVTSIITDDPKLEWNAAGYYALQAGSPAIDAGVSTYDGVTIPSVDVRGTSRPQGAGYDIGAYEFGPDPVPVVTVSPDKYTLKVGSYYNLSADSTMDKDFEWSSSSPDVVSVDQDGKILAVSVGKAEIKVEGVTSGKFAISTITAIQPADAPVVITPEVAQKLSEDAGDVGVEFGFSNGPGILSIDRYEVISNIPNANLLEVGPVTPTELPP